MKSHQRKTLPHKCTRSRSSGHLARYLSQFWPGILRNSIRKRQSWLRNKTGIWISSRCNNHQADKVHSSQEMHPRLELTRHPYKSCWCENDTKGLMPLKVRSLSRSITTLSVRVGRQLVTEISAFQRWNQALFYAKAKSPAMRFFKITSDRSVRNTEQIHPHCLCRENGMSILTWWRTVKSKDR